MSNGVLHLQRWSTNAIYTPTILNTNWHQRRHVLVRCSHLAYSQKCLIGVE